MDADLAVRISPEELNNLVAHSYAEAGFPLKPGVTISVTISKDVVLPRPVQTGPLPDPLIPLHTIPKVPFAITGAATWWGLNPDGSNDTGDVDEHGKNLLGAFSDNNHNEQIVGCSIPIKVFHATIGTGNDVYKQVESRRYKFDFLSHVTGRHITGVWLTDLGPNEKLNRPFDLTYAANKMLGHKSGTNTVTGWIIDTHSGQIMEFKGWDFENGKVAA